MSGKNNQHPSFESDSEGHHYVPGRSRGNADYFSRPAPPVRDSATGHPIGSDGKIDWAEVIREANEKDS